MFSFLKALVRYRVCKSQNSLFIGSSINVLSSLYEISNVVAVFIEDNVHKVEVVNFCRKKKVNFYYVRSSSDISKVFLEKKLNPDLALVAYTGIILKQDLIDKMRIIFNFHNGDLSTNRGAHPIYHSILSKSDFMYLVCHTLESEKIDSGRIVCEIKVPINYDLDFKSNIKIIHSFFDSVVRYLVENHFKYGEIKGVVFDPASGSYKDRIEDNLKREIQSARKLKDLKIFEGK